MAFRAAHAVHTSHVAQPAGWFTGWSLPSRPDSEEAWSTSTSSWMWPSSATPSPALRHTAQEGRPGARGSPEQGRREPEEGGAQKRWRGRGGGSGWRSTGGGAGREWQGSKISGGGGRGGGRGWVVENGAVASASDAALRRPRRRYCRPPCFLQCHYLLHCRYHLRALAVSGRFVSPTNT